MVWGDSWQVTWACCRAWWWWPCSPWPWPWLPTRLWQSGTREPSPGTGPWVYQHPSPSSYSSSPSSLWSLPRYRKRPAPLALFIQLLTQLSVVLAQVQRANRYPHTAHHPAHGGPCPGIESNLQPATRYTDSGQTTLRRMTLRQKTLRQRTQSRTT